MELTTNVHVCVCIVWLGGVCVNTCVLSFPDSTGNVIDLVKDQLPELQLSEEDRQKNLELLEQAKKVSDRFLTRRGRRSTSSLTESPTGGARLHTHTVNPQHRILILKHHDCVTSWDSNYRKN